MSFIIQEKEHPNFYLKSFNDIVVVTTSLKADAKLFNESKAEMDRILKKIKSIWPDEYLIIKP